MNKVSHKVLFLEAFGSNTGGFAVAVWWKVLLYLALPIIIQCWVCLPPCFWVTFGCWYVTGPLRCIALTRLIKESEKCPSFSLEMAFGSPSISYTLAKDRIVDYMILLRNHYRRMPQPKSTSFNGAIRLSLYDVDILSRWQCRLWMRYLPSRPKAK